MGRVNYALLSTEQIHPRSRRLDQLSTSQIVRLMNDDHKQVFRAIAGARPALTRAIGLIVEALRDGGRLFFVGAGTSGRLGVIEAAECPPTFGTPPSLIQALMAGGKAAVFRSQEGSEDSEKDAVSACRRIGVRKGDVVVGIAASGITPFVGRALRTARTQRAKTILLTCNPAFAKASADKPVIDLAIVLKTGPEILTGSTRLKAGTACKMALNILTTASMVRLGKVYGNRMVDLQPKSRKLVARGIRLVQELGHVSIKDAEKFFRESQGNVKTAIVMARKKVSHTQAAQILDLARGFLKDAL